jgi:hypothetical protein
LKHTSTPRRRVFSIVVDDLGGFNRQRERRGPNSRGTSGMADRCRLTVNGRVPDDAAMGVIIFYLALYGIISLGILALGAGMGFLLHWLLPAIDLGSGVLIGVVVAGFSIHFFSSLVTAINEYQSRREEEEKLAEIPVNPWWTGLPPGRRGKRRQRD